MRSVNKMGMCSLVGILCLFAGPTLAEQQQSQPSGNKFQKLYEMGTHKMKEAVKFITTEPRTRFKGTLQLEEEFTASIAALKEMKNYLSKTGLLAPTSSERFPSQDDSFFVVAEKMKRLSKFKFAFGSSVVAREVDQVTLSPVNGSSLFYTSSKDRMIIDGSNPKKTLGNIKIQQKRGIFQRPYFTLTQTERFGNRMKKSFVTVEKLGRSKGRQYSQQAVLYHHGTFARRREKGMMQDDNALLITSDEEEIAVLLAKNESPNDLDKGHTSFFSHYTVRNAKTKAFVGVVSRAIVRQDSVVSTPQDSTKANSPATVTTVDGQVSHDETITTRMSKHSTKYQLVYTIYVAPGVVGRAMMNGNIITKDQMSLEMVVAAMALDIFFPVKKSILIGSKAIQTRARTKQIVATAAVTTFAGLFAYAEYAARKEIRIRNRRVDWINAYYMPKAEDESPYRPQQGWTIAAVEDPAAADEDSRH